MKSRRFSSYIGDTNAISAIINVIGKVAKKGSADSHKENKPEAMEGKSLD